MFLFPTISRAENPPFFPRRISATYISGGNNTHFPRRISPWQHPSGNSAQNPREIIKWQHPGGKTPEIPRRITLWRLSSVKLAQHPRGAVNAAQNHRPLEPEIVLFSSLLLCRHVLVAAVAVKVEAEALRRYKLVIYSYAKRTVLNNLLHKDTPDWKGHV